MAEKKGSRSQNFPALSIEQERERTIRVLSDHFANDSLSLEDLEARLEAVYRAGSVPALRALTADLPEGEPEPQGKKARAVPALASEVEESDRIVSVMSDTKRGGMWLVPRRLQLWSIMADTKIDLTEAQLADGVTEINVRALMAAVKLIVPPGVRVVFQPTAFMADVRDESNNPPPVGSGAPVVRITGVAVMAELKVFVRTRELLED